ncbi:hypothetical protein AVEN_246877-1 [Araneus ventricosus]|uniref:Uncharacterized protein n=1 Tax=Araneus ventricosus TaxID=182803 RepID=A0A4Y2KY28_ARAVE|nr:hypothetical protein AVEN_246877-1 [Araneus ventricosus]
MLQKMLREKLTQLIIRRNHPGGAKTIRNNKGVVTKEGKEHRKADGGRFPLIKKDWLVVWGLMAQEPFLAKLRQTYVNAMQPPATMFSTSNITTPVASLLGLWVAVLGGMAKRKTAD